MLRTYISLTGVEWSAGDICVFDGVEHTRERCARWYADRLDLEKAAQLQREETHSHPSVPTKATVAETAPRSVPLETVPLPANIVLTVAKPIIDRKSAFVGRACRISYPSEASLRPALRIFSADYFQVPAILDHLMSDRKISRAAHPIIHAWRCSVNGVMQSGTHTPGDV